MLRSKSLCTSACGLVLVAIAALLSMAVPRAAVADTSVPGVVCSKGADGSYTCSDGTGGFPSGVTCTVVDGVNVCSDGSTGGSGSTCVVDNVTGRQTCLSSVGGVTTGPLSNLGKGLGKVMALPGQNPSTGWLSQLTSWFANTLHTLFTAIAQLLKDLVTYVIAAVLGLFEMAIDSITPPAFLTQYSMQNLLGQTGPVVMFFMAQFQIPAGLGILASGWAFRLARKFLTLFQW